MNKEDYYYYGTLYGIPIYFQPDVSEVVPRNKFYGFLLDLLIPFYSYLSMKGFAVKIYKKTITREELVEKGLVED